MSHELTAHKDGRVEFAYLEQDGAPWHGLGQKMTPDSTLTDWRAAAGMDWKIQRSAVRYNTDRSSKAEFNTLDDSHVLFRSDTKAALGIVSAGYKVVQPAAVLEFFRDLVRSGGLELSAAGTIQGGRRFWATAKIGEASPVSIKDKIGGYLLLSTSSDGSMATEARLTSIRVVCKNTLGFARAENKAAMKISHRSVFDADAVKVEMGLNTAAWDAFRHNVTRMANVSVQAAQAEHMVAQLVGGVTLASDQAAVDEVRATKAWIKIMDLFNGAAIGSELDGVRGTGWGLVNAVTEYVDHHAAARSDENRFISSQWGPNARLKADAVAQVLALV